ncbi:MAG: hypothetical protein S4CHLAM81_02960 [Chlamydiales bacterium]|nr:hypothetical protein [Chlamydiales bacterium]MCH9635087.1 hypothetical protein [Chlamydiales bacterium]MCH9703484.1 hypothetical protein [Chlamydiota bacterium]
MRRKSYKKYLVLAATLFALVSLPTLMVEKLRCKVVALAFPFLRSAATKQAAETKKLEAQNYLLKMELAQLKVESRAHSSFPDVVIAHVIYRNPHSWGSVFWVDAGEDKIAVNSPVLVGDALIGLVDHVGKKQSRVRLITDVGLKPSVRAVRGALQNAQLCEHVVAVLRHLQGRVDLPLEELKQLELIAELESLQRNLDLERESWFLAKGILEGGGSPLWRSRSHVLRGIGFNYDFADDEGLARPLQSEPPILQAHDLLVTTGLDGFFPAGLRVAEVSQVLPLKEGAYAYEIEATPVVKNLDSVQTVHIVPRIYQEPFEGGTIN